MFLCGRKEEFSRTATGLKKKKKKKRAIQCIVLKLKLLLEQNCSSPRFGAQQDRGSIYSQTGINLPIA